MKLITYRYIHGDGHTHQTIRTDSEADKFVGHAASHGRQIITVTDHPETPAETPQDRACPVCQARPGQPCTQPTDTGRRPVTWFHLNRENTDV